MKDISLSARFRNIDISRQVERLEKEFEFWTEMYQQITPRIKGTALEQVEQIQSNLEVCRETYRAGLEKDLGRDFSVSPLDVLTLSNPLRNYFFPVEYQEKFAGIIMPFMKKKKAILNSRLKDNKYAKEVLHSRGYRIQNVVGGMNKHEAYLMVEGDEESIALSLAHKDMI
jgi:hypothetical protein